MHRTRYFRIVFLNPSLHRKSTRSGLGRSFWICLKTSMGGFCGSMSFAASARHPVPPQPQFEDSLQQIDQLRARRQVSVPPPMSEWPRGNFSFVSQSAVPETRPRPARPSAKSGVKLLVLYTLERFTLPRKSAQLAIWIASSMSGLGSAGCRLVFPARMMFGSWLSMAIMLRTRL